MKYLAAIPIILLFVLLDALMIITLFGCLIGFALLDGKNMWPFSVKFAERVWR